MARDGAYIRHTLEIPRGDFWDYHTLIHTVDREQGRELICRFLKYNNYKHHIINNKSDKNKILNLRMAVCYCQWRGANVPLLWRICLL
jgi:hypothetical protein